MNLDLVKQTINAYDKIANQYAKCWSDDSCMEESINIFVNYLREKNKTEMAKVLDAGCGVGRDFKSLINKGLDVTGIDLSKKMLFRAKKNVPNGKFEIMDLREITYDSSSFDGIWANASLLHVPRKEIGIVLTHFYRILKINGILFISLQEGSEEVVDPDARLFVRYSRDDVEELLKHHNFEIIQTLLNESTKNTYNVTITIKWMNFYAMKRP